MPERTCVVCRKGKTQEALLRFVRKEDGTLFLDGSGVCHGRGAYCCRQVSCISERRLAEKLFASFKTGSKAPKKKQSRENFGSELLEEAIVRLRAEGEAKRVQTALEALEKLNTQLQRAEGSQAGDKSKTPRIRL